MQPLLVPAASQTVLQPGAIHVALINLDHDLTPGQSFPMQLVFAHAGTITVAGSGRGQRRRRLDRPAAAGPGLRACAARPGSRGRRAAARSCCAARRG